MSVPVAVGTVIADRYRVDRLLGEGGMGVVVMATHLVLQQRVAIKFLRREAMADGDAINRFVREARAAAKVQSEHVVRVSDVAVLEDGTPYMVMEYVEGVVLSKLLVDHGQLPVLEAVRYALQTCEALIETHAAGIVHGDLKPENIYIAGSLDGPRRVKLLDFGISKGLLEDRTTKPSFVMGTPRYMAPEQFKWGRVEPKSDQWALGAVLYEMLAGVPPFEADTPEDIQAQVMSEPLSPILRPDMPAGLNDVIARCMRKDPSQRYPSATDVAMALEVYAPVESSLQRLSNAGKRLKVGVNISQRLVPTVVLPHQRRSHGTWAAAALGLVGIVGLVLVLVGATRRYTVTRTTPSRPAVTTDANPVSSPHTPSTPELVESVAAVVPSASASSASRTPRPRVARPPPTSTDARHAAPSPPSAEADRFGTRK